METARARDGNESVLHAEATALVAPPPATQTRAVDELGVVVVLGVTVCLWFFDAAVVVVHEEAADDAGAAVHVFVVAPSCEVDVPVVQFEGDVPDGVGEIPAYYYAQAVAVSCDEFDVEELARVELDAGEEDQGGGGVVLGDYREDVFGCEVRRVGRGWGDGDEGGGGDVVVLELRLGSVLAGCEHDDERMVWNWKLTWSLGKAFPSMMIL